MRILVLFTRDLRVHDHPALDAAVHDADQVLPLFVADPALLAISPNRARFLMDAIEDLDTSLSDRGARLLIRSGDPAVVAPWKAARRRCDAIYLTEDVTPRARRRIDAMRRACEPAGIEVRTFPGHAVVEPGTVTPAGRPAYRVFTPYLHAWLAAPRRPVIARPPLITSIPYLHPGRMPARDRLPAGAPRLPRGGETTGRRLMQRFLRQGVRHYESGRDRLDADATSRLSPYLRFGCISTTELEEHAVDHPRAEAFVRQLAWRDFFFQLLAADPGLVRTDLRPERAPRWREDPAAVADWKAGETGEPLVDAGMRQLLEEGWMPNRARLIAASYLTRTLGIDWRVGAAHFARHLVDGDPASNAGNWQWVAGTGANPRRGLPLNLDRQARRFDPTGSYRAGLERHG